MPPRQGESDGKEQPILIEDAQIPLAIVSALGGAESYGCAGDGLAGASLGAGSSASGPGVSGCAAAA